MFIFLFYYLIIFECFHSTGRFFFFDRFDTENFYFPFHFSAFELFSEASHFCLLLNERWLTLPLPLLSFFACHFVYSLSLTDLMTCIFWFCNTRKTWIIQIYNCLITNYLKTIWSPNLLQILTFSIQSNINPI